MKRRFIFTIGFVLTLTIGSVGMVQFYILQEERLRSIDQRIENIASLLTASDLTTAELNKFEDAEDIIAEADLAEKFNQFVIIYGGSGRIAYRSQNAKILPEGIPLKERWQSIETPEHYIRVLTVPMEKAGLKLTHPRILQTGLIFDPELISRNRLGEHLLIYGLLIVVLVILVTYILSRSLLFPLRQLADFLRHIGFAFDQRQLINIADTTAEHTILSPKAANQKDEFGQLIQAASELRDRIHKSLRVTQNWTAQMAHELKTPLTIVQNSLERLSLQNSDAEREKLIAETKSEVLHLTDLINSFLEWTAAENLPASSTEMHANKVAFIVHDLVNKLKLQYPNRLQCEIQSSHIVFSNPSFLQQAISNLLINALKYSTPDSLVKVRLKDSTLEVENSGPIVPHHVLERLGQPFNHNRGVRRGFGLGLAWVSTVCQKYGWQLSFANRQDGALVRIEFPTVDSED